MIEEPICIRLKNYDVSKDKFRGNWFHEVLYPAVSLLVFANNLKKRCRQYLPASLFVGLTLLFFFLKKVIHC